MPRPQNPAFKMLLYRTTLLGPKGCGKTSLFCRFGLDYFSPDISSYGPTTEGETLRKQMVLRSTSQCVMWEINDDVYYGEDNWVSRRYLDALNAHLVDNADGVLVCYSVRDRKGFEDVDEWRAEIGRLKRVKRAWERKREGVVEGEVDAMAEELANGGMKVPIVLVGCRSDCGDEREVAYEEGREKAREWGVPFLECSAKTGEGVEEVFVQLAGEIRRVRDGVVEGGEVRAEKRGARLSMGGLRGLLKGWSKKGSREQGG
ncbi:P-loop containing nucleoside triphosphate hydrolase protein [Trematosphaeria pertusa]|uniref:P-loop containing nucleoside triphosphate hydrolase protein n=1 Tax=Trematosphaeria pertusa TaxID=390896 RepID=A0A6A6IZX0_9PLEO|nr:P-loop containing nucleoside triphosphate hydrolase protein [Trematosphaeria pertusa]KAF2255617.1 P-loop containing nucleoside triphosphate hydrolase protein [Trematosphaeria pertusa]